jgi:hypothetical protein
MDKVQKPSNSETVLLLLIPELRVQISDLKLAVLSEGFHGLTHSLHANIGINIIFKEQTGYSIRHCQRCTGNGSATFSLVLLLQFFPFTSN